MAVIGKHYDLDTDGTLANNSDNTIASQKAVKTYVDKKQDIISDLSSIRSGANAGATAIQPSDLANVATSGSYNDLTNKPTIPTVNNASLVIQKNSSDVATFTANASTNVTCNITVPTTVAELSDSLNYIQTSELVELATVAETGSYNDLTDKPAIPQGLELLYPVGAVYIGTMATCPLATLGIGSWEKIASDQVLQGSSVNHSAGDIIAAGLPNITGDIVVRSGFRVASANGAFFVSASFNDADEEVGSDRWRGAYSLDASRSSSIYGNSTTVQPPAFVVNIWRRIS